jgi:hypothetical protein
MAEHDDGGRSESTQTESTVQNHPDQLTLIAGWIAEQFCDADGIGGVDGADLEQAMKEIGLVHAETYDVEKHGAELQEIGLEPGEDAALILSARASEARCAYRRWAAEQEKRRCPQCKAKDPHHD